MPVVPHTEMTSSAAYRSPRVGEPPFDLIGGLPCLDLLNTLNERSSGPGIDSLQSYADLVAWARQAGVLSDRYADDLLAAAGSGPGAVGGAVLERARSLREALFRLLTAFTTGQAPRAADLGIVSSEVAVALGHRRLVTTDEGFHWDWDDEPGALDRLLWPVAQSSADLLTDAGALARVRECGQETCRWFFLDSTRNRSRQWCEMRTCGNRAKARRHYERKRGRSAEE